MTRFDTKKRSAQIAWLFSVALAAALLLGPEPAHADIDGITGTSFSLTARDGYVSVADGAAVYSWGYSANGTMQLPGPTLIVTEGVPVTVTLYNELPAAAGNVSILFPGQQVTPSDCPAPEPPRAPGLLTEEAVPGGCVVYAFTPDQPGTYQYHSGTRPDLQVEMGLYGALIVEPATPAAGCTKSAYDHPGTCFDREYLFLLSEIDLDVHRAAEAQAGGPGPIEVVTEPYRPEYWLMNGRTAPDTMAAAGTATLPTQPYNCVPRMEPGERVLQRIVGAGRQMHPFHHHGNHARVLARDGRLVVNDADQLAGPLLFTIPSVPGKTVDAIFEWTGKDLGWDIYGTGPDHEHSCNGVSVNDSNPASSGFDPATHEYCPDHGRELPVTLPSLNVLAFGGFWSGSPYLGVLGSLPPGEGGLNPNAGFAFMWHSHTERELVNNDVFPGGMLTMLIIEAPGTLGEEP